MEGQGHWHDGVMLKPASNAWMHMQEGRRGLLGEDKLPDTVMDGLIRALKARKAACAKSNTTYRETVKGKEATKKGQKKISGNCGRQGNAQEGQGKVCWDKEG